MQIHKPDEYQFTIADIKRRYKDRYIFDEEKHIEDLLFLLKYVKYDSYQSEVLDVINHLIVIKCTDNSLKNPNRSYVFVPKSADNLNFEAYFANIRKYVWFVDMDYYSDNGISIDDLKVFGVKDSLLIGEDITRGEYSNGQRGRQPEWWTTGEFRWKLSMESLKDVLKYISNYSDKSDAIIKSQVIFKTLLLNERKLRGTVQISGSTPNLENETCELIKTLNGGSAMAWDGKWLFTDALELTSHKNISKYDISNSIYGLVDGNSNVYEILGFRKTEADEVDDLKKSITEKQLNALFEHELLQRFGITSAELNEHYKSREQEERSIEQFEFPVGKIKNWETLRKHAAEMGIKTNLLSHPLIKNAIQYLGIGLGGLILEFYFFRYNKNIEKRN